jgi:hypothetical protein
MKLCNVQLASVVYVSQGPKNSDKSKSTWLEVTSPNSGKIIPIYTTLAKDLNRGPSINKTRTGRIPSPEDLIIALLFRL